MTGGIVEIDVLQERYRRALEFKEWFKPAWETISEDDRFALAEFYCSEYDQTEAIGNIGERFHIERSSAYKRKNRALDKLTILLYGR
jgi:hypothetical protein